MNTSPSCPGTPNADRAGPGPDPEPSTLLLARARSGDRQALDRLCNRYLPRLRRWASGRLPGWARDVVDTNDLAQETLLRVLGRLSDSEFRVTAGLNAYLRQALLNRITDEIRRAKVRPERIELPEQQVDSAASPLEEAIGTDVADRYESALARLDAEEREMIVARIEMGLTYQEIADELEKPSPDAVRMAVSRALIRLAKEMDRGS